MTQSRARGSRGVIQNQMARYNRPPLTTWDNAVCHVCKHAATYAHENFRVQLRRLGQSLIASLRTVRLRATPVCYCSSHSMSYGDECWTSDAVCRPLAATSSSCVLILQVRSNFYGFFCWVLLNCSDDSASKKKKQWKPMESLEGRVLWVLLLLDSDAL